MGLFKNAMRKGIPGRDAGASMGGTMPEAPRPTLIQGGPAYFTPEGYRPPIQPQQAFMPTDTMGDPIGDMFRRQLPPVRNQLPRMPPPRDPRDGFISIGGVGGNDGIDDPRMQPMPSPINENPGDYMPRDPGAGMIATPAPTPPGMGGGSFGTFGGSGYGRFPLGSAGPEYLYDDDGNPIMEPKFNTTITGDGTMEDMIPKPPMPPMAPPMAPPLPNLGGTPSSSILGDFVPPSGYREGKVGNNPLRDPAAGLKPIRQDLLPPKRDDFMSIGGPGGIGATPDTGMLDPNTRISNYDTDRQTRGLQLQATPAPGNTNNFGGVDLGGTPSSSILDDFVPPPGYKEPVDSNDSDRFNPIPGLTPKAQPGDFMPRTPEVGLAQPAPIAPPQDMMDLPVSNNQTPLTQPIANPRNPEMFAEIQKRINDLGVTSLNQDLEPIQQMPMMPELPRMPMPAPIATPMPMSPIDLPRLDLQELDSMDRQMSISRDFMPGRNLSLANKPMLMPLESRMPMMPRRRGR